MKDNRFWPRFFTLIFGLLLYSLGIAVTLQANIGYSPWDVFHSGIAKVTGISIGMASVSVGVIIVITVHFLGEKLGLGSVLNMLLIGSFLDLILYLDFIPLATSFPMGVLMLVVGMFIISLASYFYMKSAFGIGPRDGLMVAITRKTKLPVGVCKAIVEFIAAVSGYALGGSIGLGTIIFAFTAGFCIQITFKLLKFDVIEVKHENLAETLMRLKKKKSESVR